MNNKYNIIVPKPVLFNCWKHHKLFIQEEINNLSKFNREEAVNTLKKLLLVIGESQTDLYTGNLSPLQISDFILVKLKNERAFEKNEYESWIKKSNTDYKTTYIKDGSCWTLRTGENDEFYIHIHPCRNSLNSIRVRSLNLKTAIAVLVWSKINQVTSNELDVVNYVRREILSECPIKSLEISKGLNKTIRLLLDK